MVKMTRYQWLLIVLLSANFGVVFFDRNTISYLGSSSRRTWASATRSSA